MLLKARSSAAARQQQRANAACSGAVTVQHVRSIRLQSGSQSAVPVATSRINKQRSLLVAQATQATQATAPAGTIALPGARTDVIVLGSQGAASIQLVKALLEAGFKVTAGVDDIDAAKETLAFVKKYELLDRAALANLKLADTEKALPKRAKVILVEGDVVGDKKVDAKFLEQALDTADSVDASQVILVTSGSASAAAGGFFNFGSSNSSGSKLPNKNLSRTEQLLANSGLPFTIVRAATSDSASEEASVAVAAGPGAAAPAAAPISQQQLVSVLGAVLSQPAPPAGLPVVLEVTATSDQEEAKPVSAAVAEAVAEIKSKAPIPSPDADNGNGAVGAASLLPLGTLSTIGTISMRKAAERKAAQEQQPKGTLKLTNKRATAQDEDEDDDEEEGAAKPRNFLSSLFGGTSSASGTTKISASSPSLGSSSAGTAARKPAPAPAAPAKSASNNPFSSIKRAMSPEPAAAAAPKPAGNPFSTVKRSASPPAAPASKSATGTTKVAATKAPAAPAKGNPFSTVSSKRPPTPARGASDDEDSKKEASPGFFGFFAAAPKRADSPEPANKRAGTGSTSSAKAAPPAKPAPVKVAAAPAKAAASSRAAAPEKPERATSPSFNLGSLFGWGAGAQDDEEEEAPRGRAPARKPAPPPAPAKRAAAASASIATPAKPAGNPFSTVKRSVQAPEPAKPAAKPAPAARPGTTQVSKAGTQKVSTQKVSTTQKAAPASGTQRSTVGPKGTYRPVSGYTVTPKK